MAAQTVAPVRIPPELLAELDAIAARQGVTRSEVMRRALATWLHEHANELDQERAR